MLHYILYTLVYILFKKAADDLTGSMLQMNFLKICAMEIKPE